DPENQRYGKRILHQQPPLFRGIKYDYWKQQMISHFESIHIDLWVMVENGKCIPYDDQLNEIPRSWWMEKQKLRFLLDSKAQNCKQIYDTLVVTYEGTSQVKRSKFNLLTRKYELFSMEEGKDIKENSNEDELAFISQKIHKIWKNKGGSRRKKSSKKVLTKKKDKDKISIICYECKKPKPFKFECPKLEKVQDKKKHYNTKEKRRSYEQLGRSG
ncbi:hypothetical protein D0Y65_050697, partial [Glycine soja]